MLEQIGIPLTLILLSLWAILPIFCLLIAQNLNFDFTKISIVSITIFFILVFQYIGLPFIYFQLDPFRVHEIINLNYILKAWGFTSLALIFLIAGASTYNIWILGSNKNEVLESDVYKFLSSKDFLIFKLLLLGSGFFALVLYVQQIGFDDLAIVLALSGTDSVSINESRSDMGNNFISSYHWYRLFMRDFLIVTCLAFFIDWLKERKFFSLIFLLFSGILCIFSLVMLTEKSPIIEFTISLILVYMIVRYQGQINPRLVLKLIIPLLLLMVSLYVLFMDDSDLLLALFGGLSRIFTGSIHALYYHLDFGANHNLLNGTSFPNPGGIFNFETFSLTQYLWQSNTPNEMQGLGSAPTIFWADLYLNLGFFSIPIFSFIIGFLLTFLDEFCKKRANGSITIAAYVTLIMHYKNLSITSFANFMFDFTALSLILLIIFSSQRIFLGKY
tara:strand:- start:1456 stop:2790 length:1335 start_codon:yes stop_codon:yes gene_type:complete